MPVHAAGPRLYGSVKFKHLVKKSGSGAGNRASNVSLNLTPFVDMMTILVCFLLMVFSSSGELLQAQKGLELPKAQSQLPLQQAPIIIITKDIVTYKGTEIGKVDTIIKDDSPSGRIDALWEKLDADAKKIKELISFGKYEKDLLASCEKMKQGLRPEPGKTCPDGLAILQADEGTDVRLINKIVVTAKLAGFDNLLFAVSNK